MTDVFKDDRLLAEVVELARAAGALALDYFRHGDTTTAVVKFKDGNSPVTEADKKADDFLRSRLGALLPDAGWLSEETNDSDLRLSRARIFIVDPIDGTRAFMSGDPRWGVCVALVENGHPVFGIVHMPALSKTYVAANGRGAFLNEIPIRAQSSNPDEPLVAGPPSLLKSLAAQGMRFHAVPRIPSLAYRLVRVADGGISVALASTNARDWDIAAADIILREAGAGLYDIDGRAARYNKPETRHGVLLAAAPPLLDKFLIGLRRAAVN